MNTVKGYVSSRHVFGRNHLVRDGNRLYYLKWQWKSTSKVIDIIYLTQKQYQEIKGMLLETKKEQVIQLTDKSNAVTITHKTNSKSYMRIKRYLIKQNLFKEE